MNCDPIREAVSARLDGEDPGLPDDVIDGHLSTCPGCAAWAGAAALLRTRMRVSAAPTIPDQTAAILARAGVEDRSAAVRPWQGALASVGVLQLILVIPALALGANGASAHALHELQSWDVALAVGFLFAAVRPARAWGMLPFVGALVACLAATSLLDVVEGRAAALTETTHVLEVMGLGFLWALARLTRQPTSTRSAGLRLA